MRRVTLTQYLIEQQRQYGKVSPELRLLIEVVARACKAISHPVSKGPLAGIGEAVGLDNVQGEAQKKLDVIANEVLVEAARLDRQDQNREKVNLGDVLTRVIEDLENSIAQSHARVTI